MSSSRKFGRASRTLLVLAFSLKDQSASAGGTGTFPLVYALVEDSAPHDWDALRVELGNRAWVMEVACDSPTRCVGYTARTTPMGVGEWSDGGTVTTASGSVSISAPFLGCPDGKMVTALTIVNSAQGSMLVRGCGAEFRVRDWSGSLAWTAAVQATATRSVLSKVGVHITDCTPFALSCCSGLVGVVCASGADQQVIVRPQGDEWVIRSVSRQSPSFYLQLCPNRLVIPGGFLSGVHPDGLSVGCPVSDEESAAIPP